MTLRVTFSPVKQAANLRKHGYDFSFAAVVFRDPLSITVYDRYEGGEHRWHTIGAVGGGFKVLLVVHTFPDPQGEDWIHVIGLRDADRHERRRYEDGHG